MLEEIQRRIEGAQRQAQFEREAIDRMRANQIALAQAAEAARRAIEGAKRRPVPRPYSS